MNKYTKTPNPPKEDLESLYNGEFLSQAEIGIRYGVSQRVVFRWFKDLKIKSRIASKRNQVGNKNSSWKGDKASYAAFHCRVKSLKGTPKKCEVCGTTDENKYYDWANLTGKYEDITDYKRMCRSCHWKYDKKAMNFKDQYGIPPQNKNKCKS